MNKNTRLENKSTKFEHNTVALIFLGLRKLKCVEKSLLLSDVNTKPLTADIGQS